MSEINPPGKILFLVDSTSSMATYVSSLKHSIMQLFSLINLLDLDIMVAVMSYKDQSDLAPITWSGWVYLDDPSIYKYIDSIWVGGGSADFAETSKLALTVAAIECASSKDALVIHYSDAPPHCDSFYFNHFSDGTNGRLEKNHLMNLKKPTDWVDICNNISKNLHVVTLYSKNISYRGVDIEKVIGYYALLGDVIYIEKPNTFNISKTTLDVVICHYKFRQQIDSYYCYKLNTDKIFTNEHDFGLKNAFGDLMVVPYVNAMATSGESTQTLELAAKFKENIGGVNVYRDKVYTIIKNLIQTTEGLFSLTHNNIFGTLWRAITAFKRFDKRTHELTLILQKTMTELVGYRLDIFKDWLEESYNRCSEIIATINSVDLHSDTKVFIIQSNEYMPSKLFMDAFRGNAPISLVGKIINYISTISICRYIDLSEGFKKTHRYVPIDLQSKDIVHIISHLIAPGIILSERPTAILCMFICISLSEDNELYKHASSYLRSIKGEWLDVDVPEYSDNYSSNFLSTVRQFKNKTDQFLYLTAEEVVFFDRLLVLTKVTQNLNKYINIVVPYKAKGKFLQLYDHHVMCGSCNKLRSFTLMYTKDQCGLCFLVAGKDDESIKTILRRVKSFNSSVEQTLTHLENIPSQYGNKSNIFDCNVCGAYYSVIDVDSLRIRPMCHFCRIWTVPKISECNGCSNKFVDNAGLLASYNNLCGNCTKSIKFDEVTVTIGEVLSVNPGFMKLFGITKQSIGYINSGFTIYKACTKIPPLVTFTDDKWCVSTMQKISKYKNYEDVARLLLTEVNSDSFIEECGLCLEVLPCNNLVRSCGNCTKQICLTCAKKWYSQNSPGNVALETYSRCPFCKSVPKYKIVKAYNRMLCTNNNRTHIYDNSVYEAWCRRCGVIKVHISKECANDIPQLGGTFECTVCVSTLNQSELIKACPGCKTMCYRDGGCDHIECPVKECGLHWCWQCKFSNTNSSSIYRHMEREHNYDYGYNDDSDYSDD